jgi:hypothetical protein
MNLLPYFVIWSGLAISVLGLALYRHLVSMHEDDFLHLGAGGEKLIPEQIATYDKLGGLDRRAKSLTAITLGLGVLLLVAYLYKVLQAGLA